ncbi:helix-turn-helix domain-containing protein [Streptomyces nojiriensis]|uniref:helix-turn-helix domain-containing protein n=1 Tax=Streptomyces nojiriensis TaxID=66374 RepID=UPI0035D84F88
MSRRTLIRRFRADTGRPPMCWLLDARPRLARELLESSDLRVEAVARRCGPARRPTSGPRSKPTSEYRPACAARRSTRPRRARLGFRPIVVVVAGAGSVQGDPEHADAAMRRGVGVAPGWDERDRSVRPPTPPAGDARWSPAAGPPT